MHNNKIVYGSGFALSAAVISYAFLWIIVNDIAVGVGSGAAKLIAVWVSLAVALPIYVFLKIIGPVTTIIDRSRKRIEWNTGVWPRLKTITFDLNDAVLVSVKESTVDNVNISRHGSVSSKSSMIYSVYAISKRTDRVMITQSYSLDEANKQGKRVAEFIGLPFELGTQYSS